MDVSNYLWKNSSRYEWFRGDSRGRRDLYVFEGRSAMSEKSIFCLFCLRVFSSSEVLGKITSTRSKLPTAACWSREEKRGNCEASLL